MTLITGAAAARVFLVFAFAYFLSALLRAVTATLESLDHPEASQSPNLRSIVDRIRPAIETLHEVLGDDPERLLRHAVRANIRASAGQLRQGSRILEQLIAVGGLMVVGAEYSLETGVVEFFDGLPKDGPG